MPAWSGYLAAGSVLLIAIGLPWSHSLVSIGVGGLIGITLLRPELRKRLLALFRQEPLLTWPWAALYALHLVSFLYTENCPQWWEEMRIKLPLPLLWAATVVAWRTLPENRQALILWAFHAGLLIVGGATAAKALANFCWALQEMREARYVPMVGGISHIYFAGHLIGALLLLFVTPGPPRLRLLTGALYIGIIHVLALRTALFALYGGLVLGILYWTIRKRRWFLGIGLLGSLTGLLILLTSFWGPLRSRYENLRHDLAQYKSGNLRHLSVGTRIAALEASWQVFQESPLWGVGIADNRDAVFEKEARLPYHWGPQFYLLPHHQFVEYALGFGIVGLGVFLSFWVGAFWRERHPLWWAWLAAWILLMQVEAFLERQMGLTMFLWGMGVLWARLHPESSPESYRSRKEI
jgi:hypothetical protein